MEAIWNKIVNFPTILFNAISNRYRVRNILLRIAQGVLAIFVFLISYVLMLSAWGVSQWTLFIAFVDATALGILADFIVFEFIMEPLGGPYYWENGPRHGETPNDSGWWPE